MRDSYLTEREELSLSPSNNSKLVYIFLQDLALERKWESEQTQASADADVVVKVTEKNNRKQLDPNDPRSGWKLFIKLNHFGVLPDVILDEKTGEMTTAAARGHVDVPIHKLVINTFDPVYEATPDVNPLYLKHVWNKITDKTGRILASGSFEIDHVNQDSLDNRLYQSNGDRQLQYTSGKRNNHNALRARGGSHCNTKQTAQTVDIIKTEFVNPLEELLNDC